MNVAYWTLIFLFKGKDSSSTLYHTVVLGIHPKSFSFAFFLFFWGGGGGEGWSHSSSDLYKNICLREGMLFSTRPALSDCSFCWRND